MSAKLIVRKFENGHISKSLLITITEGDNDLSQTNFGEWLEGWKALQTKKESEKSSRLVVKIVTGGDFAHFNLDTCATLINTLESKTFQKIPIYDYNQSNDGVYISEKHSVSGTDRSIDSYPQSGNDQQLTEKYSASNKEAFNFYNGNYNDSQMSLNTLCPLEYSLEKVKENNARIMENIHMLNRTLNYTKNKEIMDIVCPKSMRSYPCETCGKCFVYETGLKRHYSMRHAITEIPPRWQVVWTCIECFQVWPQQDLALSHAKQCSNVDSADCVREIKTSSLLQCEFCEKVFTSIPRLVRHAKMHSTQKNYECNICETSFSSYRAAEEHWLLCPWLKAYYSFSLPKLLLCHACDRKFKNYDQLYSHRYKIGHFMAKNNGDALDSFAYQCEICAKYFSSIPQLQVHKQQSHPLQDMSTSSMVTNYNEFHNSFFSTDNEIEQ